MKELPTKRGIASFKGTVAEFRKELQDFREFMGFVGEQEQDFQLEEN